MQHKINRPFIYLLLLLCLNCLGFHSAAQRLSNHGYNSRVELLDSAKAIQADSVEVGSIEVTGNRVTKDWVIRREMTLREGAKVHVDELDSLLRLEANKIFNTNLFITVEVLYNYDHQKKLKLSVVLIERIYTFPIPIIDVGDRNFNEWWQQRNKDFSRLVYGFTFKRDNFRGRNEQLVLGFRLGFRQNLRLQYSIPYLNKKRTVGMSAIVDYTTRNTIAYQTDANRLVFASANYALRKDLNLIFDLWNRKDYYRQHKMRLAYRSESLADTVLGLNPYYLNIEQPRSRYFELGYTYIYDFRNIQNYPTSGYYLEAEIRQRGLGLVSQFKQTLASISFAKYIPLSKRVFFGSEAKIKYSNLPSAGYTYINGLGYKSDILRGYDLYVVDGQHTAYSRNALRLKLFDRVIKVPFMPLKAFETIPLGIYPKVFFDMGYVRNNLIRTKNERFANKMLMGWGTGLDLVSFYNTVFRFEYSMNIEGDSGVFFYWQAGF